MSYKPVNDKTLAGINRTNVLDTIFKSQNWKDPRRAQQIIKEMDELDRVARNNGMSDRMEEHRNNLERELGSLFTGPDREFPG